MGKREPFRLSRLRDVLLGVFAMFAGFFLGMGLVAHEWKLGTVAACFYAILIALARHPRMVFGISVGTIAVRPFTGLGPARAVHGIETGHGLLVLGVVVVCAAVLLFLGWFVRGKDWQYGPATTSDKIVVAGIVASIPIGLAVLLWYLKTYGLH